jgi:hypothetical protein
VSDDDSFFTIYDLLFAIYFSPRFPQSSEGLWATSGRQGLDTIFRKTARITAGLISPSAMIFTPLYDLMMGTTSANCSPAGFFSAH